MFVRVRVIMLMMIVSLCTGGVFINSAARLAVMAAAILSQHNAAPQVPRQLEKFFRERHGLIEVRHEVTKGFPGHIFPFFMYRVSQFRFHPGLQALELHPHI